LLGASNCFSLVSPFPNSLGAGFLAGGVEGLFVGVSCWGVCRWALRLGGLPRRSLCFLSMGWSYKFGYFCDGKELYGGVEVLFSLGFGGGFVAAGGGEEKKLLRGDRPEHSVFRLACVDVGDSLGLVIMTSSNPSVKGLNF
jgi:hypothetical protein